MSPARADVAIVGGGLVGCALAAEIARRGRRVVVLERSEPGAEASGAAAGMLSPQADAVSPDAFFELALESRELYPDWSRGLAEETGIDPGYRRTGLLHVRFGAEPSGAPDPRAWQRAAGLAVLSEPPAPLGERLASRLSPELRGEVFFPDEGVVDPRALTRAVRRSAELRGAEIRVGVSVTGFRIEGGVCRGVDTDGNAVEADATVDAAGAWAALGGALPLPLPVAPVRGQIVELRLRRPLETIVSSDDVYLVPRADGGVLIGSTLEHVGFLKAVTAEAVARLIGAAIRIVPEVREARFVTAWSGLRPGTPDGWPVLGKSPIRGLFFATGHYRNGILLAPITARLIAGLICEEGNRDLSAFSVERFSPALAV
jgi:glycine oxidase